MRVGVLTTPTTHHLHFVRALGAAHDVALTVLEERSSSPPFPCHHPFEDQREEYERATWFSGAPPSFESLSPVARCESANGSETIDRLRAAALDAVVVFGTGRLRRPILEVTPDRILNLHGGDPADYRGLDTHLWAVYHGDLAGLVTTLHHVAPRLDVGDVVAQERLELPSDLELFQLRRLNTEACIRLVLAALSRLEREGSFPRRPLTRIGRYYSHMPAVLKDVCVRRLARRKEAT